MLCTGRSGSHTFAAACGHFTNYTAAHESRQKQRGDRLDYPDNHIEVDNRLSWMTGALEKRYPDAFYVHLIRDRAATVGTYERYWNGAMLKAWRNLRRIPNYPPGRRRTEAIGEFVDVTNANIAAFIAHRPSVTIHIEDPHDAFDLFIAAVDAEGDIAAAHRELDRRHGSKS